jgi:hypothetical protein
MSSEPTPPTPNPDAPPSEQQALQDALARLLAPVARLGVARGLPYAAVEEMLKVAFVQAAGDAHPGLLAHRKVSRISTTTGINRREVTRLTQHETRAGASSRSIASEVFTHWRTQPPYRSPEGMPCSLPRQGPEPSFERLAQTVTRDVHPRSLLDELCRLGLAAWNMETDTVSLQREIFVPQGDSVRQLGFLGENVGDHLNAAISNVLGDTHAHFEQAVFASGLSAESLESVRPAIRAQWQGLMATLVPALEACVAKDSQLQPEPQGRLRIGLYTFQESGPVANESAAPGDAGTAPKPAPVKRAGPRKK